MHTSVILLLVLCSSMAFLRGASCHRFPNQPTFFKGVHMEVNREYKHQMDVDQCIGDKLDSAGVDSACRMAREQDINYTDTPQREINDFFSEFCRPECGNAIAEAFKDCNVLDDVERSGIEFTRSLCGTNQNGSRRYQLLNIRPILQSMEDKCSDIYNEIGMCTCQVKLSGGVKELGCCLDAYHEFFPILNPDYKPRDIYTECNVDLPGGCNNSPINGLTGSSVALVSTLTTTTSVIVSFVLALSYL